MTRSNLGYRRHSAPTPSPSIGKGRRGGDPGRFRWLPAAILLAVLPGVGALADATPPPVELPPVALDIRAPQQSDDSGGNSDNAIWAAGGQLRSLIDNTAGFAAWNPQGNEQALPLDVIGLYVNAAAVAAGGSGYAVNDTITLTGGAVLKVSTVSSGAVTAVTVQTPNMYACAPANPVAQQKTSGAGTGATFTLTLLAPTGYGTRLLTRCYSGYALTAQRSDTGEQKQVGFTAAGDADWATFDGFASGGAGLGTYLTISPAYTGSYPSGPYGRVAAWNDQGGGGNDATQATATQMPFVYAGRRLGASRSIMFSAGQNSADIGTVPNPTWLNIPAGVSVAPNNVTIAVLGGHSSADFTDTADIGLGAGDPVFGNYPYLGIAKGLGDACQFAAASNNQTSLSNPVPLTDEARLTIMVSTPAAGVRCDTRNHFVSAAGNFSGANVVGGKIGGHWFSTTAGDGTDAAAAIVVPWALSQAQENALAASIYRLYGVTPQVGGAIVAIGDSHVSGYGIPFQQSWPRQMMQLLGRGDLSLTVAAEPGETCLNYASTGGGSKWTNQVAPALSFTNAQRWVLVDCGYNDLGGSATLSQVEGYYATIASQAHAAGAKVACVTDVIRNGGATLNANMAALGAYLRANSGGFCDLLIDFQSYSVFAAQAGPWNLPWFEQMDGGIHLTPAGNGLEAEIAAKAMQGVLQ